MLLKLNKKDSFSPFRYWLFALQKHGSEIRDTLLHHTQETVKELTELSEKFETN